MSDSRYSNNPRFSLVSVLWEVVLRSREAQRSGSINTAADGRALEDDSVAAVYERLVSLGLAPSPPRETLRLPTVSGVQHTVDLALRDSMHIYVVELKRRATVETALLQAFVAKLLDYALAARVYDTGISFTGVFAATVPKFNDRQREFAIGFGVISVVSDLTPCEIMASVATRQADRDEAERLASRIAERLPELITSVAQRNSQLLLAEWKLLADRG
jgi:hypothetical protein